MAYTGSSPYLSIDMYGLRELNTLPARMDTYYRAALWVTVPSAVDAVITNARSQLQPEHGYDTGLMYSSLDKKIISGAAIGVVYTLGADKAVRPPSKNETDPFPYWLAMETGFIQKDGVFWPGYHYYQNAINKLRPRLGKAAALAWRMAGAKLAAESAARATKQKLL